MGGWHGTTDPGLSFEGSEVGVSVIAAPHPVQRCEATVISLPNPNVSLTVGGGRGWTSAPFLRRHELVLAVFHT